jgi:hypothetical protein
MRLSSTFLQAKRPLDCPSHSFPPLAENTRESITTLKTATGMAGSAAAGLIVLAGFAAHISHPSQFIALQLSASCVEFSGLYVCHKIMDHDPTTGLQHQGTFSKKDIGLSTIKSLLFGLATTIVDFAPAYLVTHNLRMTMRYVCTRLVIKFGITLANDFTWKLPVIQDQVAPKVSQALGKVILKVNPTHRNQLT